MKKILMITAVVALAPIGALASGPGGSKEGAPRSKTYNNVTCAGTNVGGVFVSANKNGLEVCNDGRAKALPIQGRAIVTSAQGGYVAVDGDRDNKAVGPLDARNYARIDPKGAHCGKPKGVEDSTSSTQPKQNSCP